MKKKFFEIFIFILLIFIYNILFKKKTILFQSFGIEKLGGGEYEK